MLNLKKYFTEELLQVAILLSLLRIDRRSYLEYDIPAVGVGTHNLTSENSWERHNILIPRHGTRHPKSIDSILFNYEQQIFDELNSLGRYSNVFNTNNMRHVTTYLLNGDASDDDVVNNANEPSSSTTVTTPPPTVVPQPATSTTVQSNSQKSLAELSQEDLDLIEILWKYDGELEHWNLANNNTGGGPSHSDASSPADEPDNPDSGGLLLPPVERRNSVGSILQNVTTDIETQDGTLMLQPDEIKQEKNDTDLYAEALLDDDDTLPNDPWLGANIDPIPTVVIKKEEKPLESHDDETSGISNIDEFWQPDVFATEISLEELIDLNEGYDQSEIDLWLLSNKSDDKKEEEKKEANETEIKEDAGIEADFLDDHAWDWFMDMIHTPQFHHPRPFQQNRASGSSSSTSPSPYVRSTMTTGIEHRWQDFTMNFQDSTNTSSSSSYHAQHHHHNHQHHYPSTSNGISSNYSSPYPPPPILPTNIDSRNNLLLNNNSILSPHHIPTDAHPPYPTYGATCTVGGDNSINVTNNNDGLHARALATTPAFKLESNHQQAAYPYQNSCNDVSHVGSEGFFSSLLNDEDLQLMDMATNEGLYTMRMLDNSCSAPHHQIERNTDSDSAVSSMGSERVPSLSSDTEWMETNSDSGHNSAEHFPPTDYSGRYRWYENYMYANRNHTTGDTSNSYNMSHRSSNSLIPQKKYHLYGKRYLQEQRDTGMRSLEPSHVMHNHTYHMPMEHADNNNDVDSIQKTMFKDKMKSKSARKCEDEQLTRDEKRARSLNIPIPVYDIINLPMDEFNERLSQKDLSETQLALIRDIRRRGKNKVAAQNCRKRKLDQIMSLADEVKQMKDRKDRLNHERDFLLSEKQKVQTKYGQLYRHIFQSLRDADGNPYSPYEYSLQQSADGSVILVPRNNPPNFSLDFDHGRSKKDPNKQ